VWLVCPVCQVIRCVNSPQVEFAPPVGYVEPERKVKKEKKKEEEVYFR